MLLLTLLALIGPARGDSASQPEWIWLNGERMGESPGAFLKGFEVPGEVESARLRITADFARLIIKVNGKLAAEVEPYDPPLDLDIRPFLSDGKNQVFIVARGVPGPSAVAGVISVELKNGKTLEFSSDSSWLGEPGSRIAIYGRIDPRRWAANELPEVSPFAEYNQWKEATPGSREQLSPLPPGFEIEKVYTAKEGEDSWVSMEFDPQGRIIIGKEQRGLLRLTLPGQRGGNVKVETINDTLEECRGLVFKNGDLFANANRSRGLFRLRDSNEDGQFDDVTLLRRSEGSTGHGRNDLALGPDGQVHSIQGDVVLVPTDSDLKTVPEPSAPKELGHWVSTSPDGAGWFVHTRGLRNPYGIAFNPDSEAFTYDADNEGDVGLPFYRPTRVNHLVSGANYGWHQERGNTRSFPIWAPDTVPTTYDVGRGSPTAVKFGTHSNFPLKYREALFALDWAYGRIIAVHLTPRGASYYGSGEVFLEGRPLNVTDLDFADDGSMLFVTGGRKTQSALYRVRYSGTDNSTDRPSEQARIRSTFSAETRERRRQVEHFHGNPDPPDFELAWNALGDPDPWIRNAARVAVETQDLERWRQRALNAAGDLHGLTALLALVRQGTENDRAGAVKQAATFDTAGMSRPEQLALLRIYELSEISSVALGLRSSMSMLRELHLLLESPSDPVRRETVRVLAMLDSTRTVPAGMRFMAAAEDQLERLHYLEVLSEAQLGWTDELRRAYFQALIHGKRFSYGDRFMEVFFKTLESNALAAIADDKVRQQFEVLLAKSDAIEPEPEAAPPRKPIRVWAVADFDDVLETALLNRDLENGRKMYDAALCSRCHVAGTLGRPVGPDLTTVARRFSRKDLLEAIIEPSKVVAEVHRNMVIKKKDGSLLQGRIIQNDFRKSLLYVATNPFLPGDLTEIPKGDIDSFEESLISPMPPSLLNTLTKDEVLDLIAWLEAGGNTPE